MKQDDIKAMQEKLKRLGYYSAMIDGFWGPKSIVGCQLYLKSLMPKPHPWPATDEASLSAFFGKPGDESKLVSITFPYPMLYDGRPVRTTRCHHLVAASLLRVLSAIGKRIKDRLDNDAEIADDASDYGGCYNNRAMRGGSRPSLHARGAAIDLDADDNGNFDKWPERADMPLAIMEEFAREGWVSAGAFWLRDAMHFQATR